MTVILRLTGDSNRILLLALVGSVYGAVIIAVVNLLYFLRKAHLALRLLTPGIATIIQFLAPYREGSDFYFFMTLSLSNFFTGVVWYYKIRNSTDFKS